jgi:hypothetical protein
MTLLESPRIDEEALKQFDASLRCLTKGKTPIAFELKPKSRGAPAAFTTRSQSVEIRVNP